jgi:predicted DNA-binding transcriptional regulator YafY
VGAIRVGHYLELLIELIEKERTGSPEELAKKLGVKVRMVYRIMDDLRLTASDVLIFCKEKK